MSLRGARGHALVLALCLAAFAPDARGAQAAPAIAPSWSAWSRTSHAPAATEWRWDALRSRERRIAGGTATARLTPALRFEPGTHSLLARGSAEARFAGRDDARTVTACGVSAAFEPLGAADAATGDSLVLAGREGERASALRDSRRAGAAFELRHARSRREALLLNADARRTVTTGAAGSASTQQAASLAHRYRVSRIGTVETSAAWVRSTADAAGSSARLATGATFACPAGGRWSVRAGAAWGGANGPRPLAGAAFERARGTRPGAWSWRAGIAFAPRPARPEAASPSLLEAECRARVTGRSGFAFSCAAAAGRESGASSGGATRVRFESAIAGPAPGGTLALSVAGERATGGSSLAREVQKEVRVGIRWTPLTREH